MPRCTFLPVRAEADVAATLQLAGYQEPTGSLANREPMIVDGYVRVSNVGGRSGDSFHSPALQRERILAWAASRQVVIAEIFEELDESGARSDRPLLEEAVSRVERGESRGIVVAKLDRFGRSLLHGLSAIERIQAAGGTFVSVEDGFDIATDTGRLILRIMLSMAEWELDRIRASWAAAQARAVAQGKWLGIPPTGYRLGRKRGLEPHPKFAPVVTELFRRRADGDSISSLCRDLHERGIETPAGGEHWFPGTVRSLFRNRAYLGEIRWGRQIVENTHKALIDAATWHRANSFPERPQTRAHGQPALLRGFLRCGSCGRLLASGGRKGGPKWLRPIGYKCHGVSAAGPCPRAVSIAGSTVEAYVEAVFWQGLGRRGRRRPRHMAELEAEVARRERALCEYRDNARIATALGSERFAAGIEARVRRVETAAIKLGSADAADRTRLPTTSELKGRWAAMSLEQRRELILAVLDCGFVCSAGRGADERVAVFPRGGAPANLPGPTPGRRNLKLRPLEDDERAAALQLAKAPRGEREVRKDLMRFLEGRERWPLFAEFQADGEAMLWRDARMTGGTLRWSRELGITTRPPEHEMGDWTTDRIRRELLAITAGATHFPTAKELRRRGLHALTLAIQATGGAQSWAAELGLPRRTPGAAGARSWSDEQIEEALRAFTDGRKWFPTRTEFEAAGQATLYQAVGRHGGRKHWARIVGVRLKGPKQTGRSAWTDEHIEQELRRFLDGHRTFPAKTVFFAAGKRALWEAARRHGGLRLWATRTDTALTNRQEKTFRNP